MFEAIVFVAGAVLFFLAVLFFVFLWQDRLALAHRHREVQAQLTTMKEQRVDLDIRERELRVWAEGLEHQQLAIAKAEEEYRMLTAAKQAPDHGQTTAGYRPAEGDGRRRPAEQARDHATKNAKRSTSGKLLP